MRKIRLAVTAALVATIGALGVAAFPSDAEAMTCGELDDVCRVICQVGQAAKLECLQ